MLRTKSKYGWAAGLVGAISLTVAGQPFTGVHQEAGYAEPGTCENCHAEIAANYRKTAMARSFYPAAAEEQGTYYHAPSDSYFSLIRRDGASYQRRYQLDSAARPVNVMEKRIDFVLGSGNHARTYLHRTERNTLVELPLAWYAEKGGSLAMNPGYDRPDHEGFRRAITYDCMFCHNAYPAAIPAGHEERFAEPVYAGSLPQGIDCQRCHGPGLKHAQLAKTAGAASAAVRAAIVNPARLISQRQMEVCLQCHLETTSFPLPNAVQREGRGPFSFRPGEALEGFLLFFDHAPGAGRDEKFEIVSAAYRLRRSACFLKSGDRLTCTTCHNPHDTPRGEAATRHYVTVCRSCHAAAFDRLVAAGTHTGESNCAGCHMPKRRTEDVVHVVVTDHYIQRQVPAADLLAERAERHEAPGDYTGEVALYYPPKLPHTAANDLDIAVAQVNQRSNLSGGIPQLTAAIRRYAPKGPEYYLELAEALRHNGEPDKALAMYREAVRQKPDSVPALQRLGAALRRSAKYPEAAETLRRAAALAPDNAATWQELGQTLQALGKTQEAIAALQRAVQLDPDLSEGYNNLGVVWSAGSDPARAEAAFREAIRIQPDSADAHGNLASLLSGAGDSVQAEEHFRIALQRRPDDVPTRYNHAMSLGRMRRFEDARAELEKCVRTDPNFPDAHQLLGDLLLAQEQAPAAMTQYREVIRIQPGSGRAYLGLASAQLTVRDVAGAIPNLRKAAADTDPAVRQEALQMLRQLGQ